MENKSTYYRCSNCSWQGNQDQLAYENMDTCFGQDQIEICPSCGSMQVSKIPFLDHKRDNS